MTSENNTARPTERVKKTSVKAADAASLAGDARTAADGIAARAAGDHLFALANDERPE